MSKALLSGFPLHGCHGGKIDVLTILTKHWTTLEKQLSSNGASPLKTLSEFYSIPKGVTHSLIKHSFITGSVLVPHDPLGVLSDQLRSHNLAVTRNEKEENLTDPVWWISEKSKKYNWVISSTMGLSNYTEYILEYGMQVATSGIAVLDRLSFIEPVARRRNFLLANKLSNMIVLSPRPKFRALGSTKDSVTSCWFLFQKPENWCDGTQVTFGLDWDRVEPLPPLE